MIALSIGGRRVSGGSDACDGYTSVVAIEPAEALFGMVTAARVLAA